MCQFFLLFVPPTIEEMTMIEVSVKSFVFGDWKLQCGIEYEKVLLVEVH